MNRWYTQEQETITPVATPTTPKTVERRYDSLSDAERAALAIRQGATYIVAPRRSVAEDGPLELLHVEGKYAVYRLRPLEQVSRGEAQAIDPPGS